ncbi:MAG: CopD family protein [Actinomycetota bacterium]|nr:CopD family protein [Actinomycetota bacterium]
MVLGVSSARSLDGADRVRLLRVGVPRLAVVAVVVVVATGVVNSLGTRDSVTDFWRVTFGRVLALKIALVALALATRHLRLPQGLAVEEATGAARSFDRTSKVRRRCYRLSWALPPPSSRSPPADPWPWRLGGR